MLAQQQKGISFWVAWIAWAVLAFAAGIWGIAVVFGELKAGFAFGFFLIGFIVVTIGAPVIARGTSSALWALLLLSLGSAVMVGSLALAGELSALRFVLFPIAGATMFSCALFFRSMLPAAIVSAGLLLLAPVSAGLLLSQPVVWKSAGVNEETRVVEEKTQNGTLKAGEEKTPGSGAAPEPAAAPEPGAARAAEAPEAAAARAKQEALAAKLAVLLGAAVALGMSEVIALPDPPLIIELEVGRLAVNKPTSLGISETAEIEVDIGVAGEPIPPRLGSTGEVLRREIRIMREMDVHVTSSDFEVEAIGKTGILVVEPGFPARWSFRVRPLSEGPEKQIKVQVYGVLRTLRADGTPAADGEVRLLRTAEETISVTVSPIERLQQILRWFEREWQPILTLIGAIGVSVMFILGLLGIVRSRSGSAGAGRQIRQTLADMGNRVNRPEN